MQVDHNKTDKNRSDNYSKNRYLYDTGFPLYVVSNPPIVCLPCDALHKSE